MLDTLPDLGFFEVHAENYLVEGGAFHHYLSRIREHYALSVHGVGLSIGGASALDRAHLDQLAALIARYAPQSFSEHLAWASHGDVRSEEHPSELQSLMRISYAVFCLKKKNININTI